MGEIRKRVREQFTALSRDTIFLDNAGGSQVPDSVVERIRAYMLGTYVQLEADYPASREATATIAQARAFTGLLYNSVSTDHRRHRGPGPRVCRGIGAGGP